VRALSYDEVAHGTEAGYSWHRRRGTTDQAEDCGCRQAHSAFTADQGRESRRSRGLQRSPHVDLLARYGYLRGTLRGPDEPEKVVIGWRRRGLVYVPVYRDDPMIINAGAFNDQT
jgi:hypothetical protein